MDEEASLVFPKYYAAFRMHDIVVTSIEWVNQGMEEGRREGREDWRHMADSVVTDGAS